MAAQAMLDSPKTGAAFASGAFFETIHWPGEDQASSIPRPASAGPAATSRVVLQGAVASREGSVSDRKVVSVATSLHRSPGMIYVRSPISKTVRGITIREIRVQP